MAHSFSRRRFVAAGLAGTVAAGSFDFLRALPAVPDRDAAVKPDLVHFSADIEPLVRVIEETPREKLLEVIVDRIHNGTNYQQLLTANFLAGIRGIQPRPVGFKFHAVLVINSAHLAAQASQDRDRWLPLIWAIDTSRRARRA